MAFLGYAAAIVIILWSFAGAGFSIDKVVSSPPRFADFLNRAFPPNLEPQVLARLGWKMLETLQIALAGAVVGIILSVPVALLAARRLIAPTWINQIVRTGLGFIRAVPDIAWALVFVVAVGLGPFAGMLAVKAVRSSTILGLVGAGGIGIELKVGFDLFDYPTAMTVILMIAVVVISIEYLSGWARTKIIGVVR